MNVSQPNRLCVAADENWRPALQGWMMEQQARQLHAGIAAHSSNRGLYSILAH
jgi:hypothetical protein